MSSIDDTLQAIAQAADAGRLTPESVENLRLWLTSPEYTEFVPQIIAQVTAADFYAIDDAFCQVIPFGTAGRRGPVGPGPNRINARTIAESFQGVCDYVRQVGGEGPFSAVIGYDTRHYSEQFARIGAEVLAANDFHAYLFSAPRATPELSFSLRTYGANIGFMVSASHNPPADNGVKVYWSDGGQIIPPHDENIIRVVSETTQVRRMSLEEGQAAGLVTFVGEEMDRQYCETVLREALAPAPPKDPKLRIVFSPLHGTGTHSVVPVLTAHNYRVGEQIIPMSTQWEPDGDFSGVRNHVPNPEEPVVLEDSIEVAKQAGADIVLASDPDADRLGVAIPTGLSGGWQTLKGGYLSALLTYYVLDELKAQGRLRPDGIVVRSMVTDNLVDDICDAYGIKCRNDLPVGFKWIANTILNLKDPAQFLFGTEQSYGSLKGTYARDKDAAVAAVLLVELCERLKSQGRTLHDQLYDLFAAHGYYAERATPIAFIGVAGRRRILRIMQTLRDRTFTEIAGMRVVEVADFWTQERRDPITGAVRSRIESPFPPDDYIVWQLSEDGRSWVSVRPSGTEPKLKFYFNLHLPVTGPADHDDVSAMEERGEALAATAEAQMVQTASEIAEA
jgi:phosphoglucomutase/phosphomannomutase